MDFKAVWKQVERALLKSCKCAAAVEMLAGADTDVGRTATDVNGGA